MKKQNVLDLLCDDLIAQNEKERSNFFTCINDDKIFINAKKYILPFLENNFNLFNLDFKFNINSSNELERYKSMLLFITFVCGVNDLIGIMPNFFKEYEANFDIETAYNEICLRVFIGNILNIRKSINKITNINQVDKDYIEKLTTLCKKILDI